MVKHFVWVMLFLAGCIGKTENLGSAASGTKSPEEQAIEKILVQYYQDLSDRDWNKYRAHFWNNATITTAWQKPGDSVAQVDVTTIDDFIKETPNGPDSQPVFEERMTDSKVEVKGSIAVAWTGYEAEFGSPDSTMHWKGTDVFTFLQHNKEWKIVSLVFEGDDEQD